MNTNDEILDLLLKRDLLLQRVSNGLSKEIASQYIKMIDEAINSLGKVDISLINMNKIIKEINSNIGLDYASVEDNFNEVAITEASFVPNGINALVGVDIVNKKLSDTLVNKIIKNSYLSDGNTIKEGFEKLDTRLQETFQNQIRLGVLNGDTTQTIIKNLKPYMTDFKDNRIDALVKTALSTVVNNTRLETYKENEEIFKGYQHQSVLDSRTTFICAERDNKEWDLELKPIGHKLPFKQTPLHYRCRSIILPLTKSYRELGLDIDEIPIGTRSSLNGYVPANTSFSQWFDKQSADFKENYLGKGRYQLYKDGKITLSDLVNQRGQTLSIKDLKGISNVPVKATVPKIDFGYDGKFNKYVENIRDEAKIVIDKLPKPLLIEEKGSSYLVKEQRLQAGNNNENTFRHEYGHHIDHALGAKESGLKILRPSFTSRDARIKDALSEDKKILKLIKRNDIIDNIEKLKKEWYIEDIKFKGESYETKYLKPIKNEYGALSDIFDGLTKGAFFNNGLVGHGSKYYAQSEKLGMETMANMFDMWASGDNSWITAKQYLPNTTMQFENIMKEVIDGKFD